MSADFHAYRRRMPHWRSLGAMYFVTWCLRRGQPGMAPAERSLVLSALRHFADVRYALDAHVVMDDHVHVILSPLPGQHLHRILQSWKSFTAHVMVREHSRRAPVWQHESWDRVVRDDAELAAARRYVENNPVGRSLDDAGRYPWLWSGGPWAT